MAGKDDILTGPRSTTRWRSCRTGGTAWAGSSPSIRRPTSAAALELIAAVGRIAEEQNHHPDVDWRYNRVFVRYTSHDAGERGDPARHPEAAAASGQRSSRGSRGGRTVDREAGSIGPASEE